MRIQFYISGNIHSSLLYCFRACEYCVYWQMDDSLTYYKSMHSMVAETIVNDCKMLKQHIHKKYAVSSQSLSNPKKIKIKVDISFAEVYLPLHNHCYPITENCVLRRRVFLVVKVFVRVQNSGSCRTDRKHLSLLQWSAVLVWTSCLHI